jgi:hypothetical protein
LFFVVGKGQCPLPREARDGIDVSPPTLFEARFFWFVRGAVDVDDLNPLDHAGTVEQSGEIEMAFGLIVTDAGDDLTVHQVCFTRARDLERKVLSLSPRTLGSYDGPRST